MYVNDISIKLEKKIFENIKIFRLCITHINHVRQPAHMRIALIKQQVNRNTLPILGEGDEQRKQVIDNELKSIHMYIVTLNVMDWE